LNASVVVKWLLADEPLVPKARKLLQEFQEGVWEELIVPEFCLREVANALWVAYRRGRITEEEARVGWFSFLQLNLRILPEFWIFPFGLAFLFTTAFTSCSLSGKVARCSLPTSDCFKPLLTVCLSSNGSAIMDERAHEGKFPLMRVR
jgi:hypothetical protein